jgi:hypothetical protein
MESFKSKLPKENVFYFPLVLHTYMRIFYCKIQHPTKDWIGVLCVSTHLISFPPSLRKRVEFDFENRIENSLWVELYILYLYLCGYVGRRERERHPFEDFLLSGIYTNSIWLSIHLHMRGENVWATYLFKYQPCGFLIGWN